MLSETTVFIVPQHKIHLFNKARRVLNYGVLGAIVLRTIMIFAGSWLVTQFSWILYVFGAFLLFTGIKMAMAKEDDAAVGDKPIVRWLRKHLRMTDTLDGENSLRGKTACCLRRRCFWY